MKVKIVNNNFKIAQALDQDLECTFRLLFKDLLLKKSSSQCKTFSTGYLLICVCSWGAICRILGKF